MILVLYNFACEPPVIHIQLHLPDGGNLLFIYWTINVPADDEEIFKFLYPLHSDAEAREGVMTQEFTSKEIVRFIFQYELIINRLSLEPVGNASKVVEGVLSRRE